LEREKGAIAEQGFSPQEKVGSARGSRLTKVIPKGEDCSWGKAQPGIPLRKRKKGEFDLHKKKKGSVEPDAKRGDSHWDIRIVLTKSGAQAF